MLRYRLVSIGFVVVLFVGMGAGHAFANAIVTYDALIIDDLGYVQQDRNEMEVLFTLLAHRYERGSVLITSNLPFSQWEAIFKDPMTTAAAIDRLVHHSVILELNLPNFRMEQAKQSKRRGGKDAEAAGEEADGAGEGGGKDTGV